MKIQMRFPFGFDRLRMFAGYGKSAKTSNQRRLCDLRVALVADAFTGEGISRECVTLLIAPTDCWRQLDQFAPDILLVESCWYGAHGEWRGLIHTASRPLRELVSHCKRRGIPTIFWAKEDPVHWQDFLAASRLFDYVFTTDSDSVERYIKRLRHRRVFPMTFAFQPRLHHPIRLQGEAGGIRGSCFAGAWYSNFPQRCLQFRALADGVLRAGSLDIFRREPPEGQSQDFPATYAACLRPQIPYVDTGAIYRRYPIGLTINTVTTSPTMYARRGVELLACGSHVFSNPCLALSTLFGDSIFASSDPSQVEAAARYILSTLDDGGDKEKRAPILRKVHAEHAWSVRLCELMGVLEPGCVWTPAIECRVVVVSAVSTASELACLLSMLDRQVGVVIETFVVAPVEVRFPDGVHRLCADELDATPEALFGWGAMVAPMYVGDLYGPHYLNDMLLGLSFGVGRAVGKVAYRAALPSGGMRRLHSEAIYSVTTGAALRRSLFPADLWHSSLRHLTDDLESGHLEAGGLVSMDDESYLEYGSRFGCTEA